MKTNMLQEKFGLRKLNPTLPIASEVSRSHEPTSSARHLLVNLQAVPPWSPSCLGHGLGRTPDLVALCGANDDIWGLRTAEESAMRTGGLEPTTLPPTTTSHPPTGHDLGLDELVSASGCPQNLHSLRAQLGHPWGAFSTDIPSAGFAFMKLDPCYCVQSVGQQIVENPGAVWL